MTAWAPTRWPRCRSFVRNCREEAALWPAHRVQLLTCLAVQYVHGMAAQAALYRHVPGEALGDLGFSVIPPFPERLWPVSEAVTIAQFASAVLFIASPLAWSTTPPFRCVHAATRVLVVVAVCQCLRAACFTVTQLPGPSAHCQPGVATRVVPSSWHEYIVVDIPRQSSRGCGDLIFSSHVTFGLSFALLFRRYGAPRPLRLAAWAGIAFQLVGILGSRKHYSVDLVVALYTVPLVWLAVSAFKVLPEDRDEKRAIVQQLLPR